MSPRSVPRADAVHLVPPLLSGRHLVALVPLDGDLDWAGRAAWDIARGCAVSRRVALIDLRLGDPSLHRTPGLAAGEGIVDALEYDRSWDLVARDVDRVFFIGTGADATDPDAVLGHARWRALHAGFRSEDALLLVFCEAAALPRLGSAPDGVVALSRDGAAPAPSFAAAENLALVSGPEGAPGILRRVSPPAPARRRRGWRPVAAGLALTVLAGLGWTILGRGAVRTAPPAPVIAQPRADSVPWTIQLAAYGGPEKAVAAADHLASEGVGAFVTPLTLDASGAVWYRVLAGAYATREGAVAARADLWRRGLAPAGQGELLHAPFSLRLAAPLPSAASDSLRRLGLPAVRWGASGTRLVGAFETPEQASIAAAALGGAGVAATLVTRTGTTP